MSNVTQTIPSYTGGISQQPDEVKVPGQVNIAKNVFPDITEGLSKRPGTRFIKQLDSAGAATDSQDQGKWFHYYRDETEQYLGQISRTGDINMWKCSDGSPVTVNSSGNSSAMATYLTHTADQDIQTLTVNDFTYITNRTKNTSMSSTKEAARPPEAFIELKKVAYASQYAVNLFDNTTTTEVTTATRVSAQSINIGYDPQLPNVGTEIFSVNGTPAIYEIDLTGDVVNGVDGYYRITDGTTTLVLDSISLTSGAPDGEHNRDSTEKLADAFRNHSDYHKLKFTIGTISERQPNHYQVSYGTKFRLVYKKGGTQTVGNVKLERTSADGSTVNTTFNATTVTAGASNSKKDLYFRITSTGQSVPVDDFSPVEYLARYQVTIDLLHGGEGWGEGDTIEVGFKGCSLLITVDSISTSKVQANLGLIRPTPTSFDTKTTVTAESIIGAIRTGIVATGNFTDANVQQIGNGLYITRSSNSFNASTPVGELLNVLTDSVEDVADLPKQCKHGYVVKVANSEAEEDDYYVKFFGHNDRDGEGVWEECAKPDTNIEFDAGTMPLQLVRQADGTFTLSTVTWDNAQVGDTSVDGTNPRPSFIGKTINKMMFFRNRLVLLSDENVVMSRPGDFTNFWAKSAIQFTATDPIDISCSSEFPAIIFDGIQVNSGLVLFTKNQQFMLTTDSDVLSPLTAKINFISAYNFNHNTNPFSLGTTIGFIDNVGQHSRFMEMARVLREGEPDVIEQSKVVSELLDKDLNIVSSSKENGFVALSEKDKKTLYCYKYFNTSDKRVHQAWFTWTFDWQIQYHFIIDDSLYIVTDDDSKCMLLKLDLQMHSNTLQTNTSDNEFKHRVHLDNAKKFTLPAALTTSSFNISATGANKIYNITVADNSIYTLGDLHYLTFSDNSLSSQNGWYSIIWLSGSDTVAFNRNSNNAAVDTNPPGTITVSQYEPTSDVTKFLVPNVNGLSNSKIYIISGENRGNMSTPTIANAQSITAYSGGANVSFTGSYATISGDYTCKNNDTTSTLHESFVVGYEYEMEVEFPKIYLTSKQGDSVRSDTRSSLILHRNKINLGASGLYQTTLKRRGKPNYTEDHESVISDSYDMNELPVQQLQTRVIPIYDRNTNTTITLKSTHPTPLTLYSMTWEGNSTNKFYSSV